MEQDHLDGAKRWFNFDFYFNNLQLARDLENY